MTSYVFLYFHVRLIHVSILIVQYFPTTLLRANGFVLQKVTSKLLKNQYNKDVMEDKSDFIQNTTEEQLIFEYE